MRAGRLIRKGFAMTLFRYFFVSLLIIGTLVPQSASAQVLYGSIVGNVKDPTEAAIPNATVTITNKETNQTRTAATNDVGFYSFPTVQSGSYSVKVTAPGFRVAEQSIAVTINSVARADMVMQVGQVSETVEVSAAAQVLQTDRSETRSEITTKALTEVPVPLGRNYQNLFVTLPGFTPPSNAHSIPSNPSRALTFNVNGTTRSSVNVRIDGASATNVWLPHISSYVPALESIETVNVVTSSFDAEQGLAGGAQVQVQIRSGSNDLHGAAFEYHSNNNLKARGFFLPANQSNPKLVYNQFGGRLGGPILKNRIFYFGSYEGTLNRQLGSRTSETVPTAAMRTGDLSASTRPVYDPATGNADGSGRLQFPGNVIPANRISPISRKIVDLLPLPNRGGPILAGNYFAAAGFLFDRHTVDSKVNFNLTDKLTSYARVSWLKFDTFNAQTFGDAIGGPPINGGNPGTGFGGTWSTTLATTYVMQPTFIIDAYFGYTLMDTNVEQPNLDTNLGREFFGIPGTNGTRRFEGGLPRFAIPGFTVFGSTENYMPYYRHDPQFQYVANANWTKGSHNIRFGMDFYRLNLNHTQPEFTAGGDYPASGGFAFAGGPTLLNAPGAPASNEYNAFATFLLGLNTGYGRLVQVPDEYTTRTWMYSAYLRDQWQVSPKLTVSYGTRYEYFPFPTRADRGMERYDFVNNKMLICGLGSVPKDCGTKVSRWNFAPRLGFAYRHSDRTVFRAGFGLNWDPWNIARSLRTNYPVLVALNGTTLNAYSGTDRTLAQGIPQVPIPDLGNGVIDLPRNYAVLSSGDEFKRSYIMSWIADVQRELGRGFVGQVAYVATRQVRQLGNLDLNVGQVPGLDRAGQPFNAKFGRTVATTLITPVGHSSYNALQSSLERRFANGILLNGSYTWSKVIGVCCNDNSDGGPSIPALQFLGRNRSVMGFDRTHNFQMMGVFELPFGKNKPYMNAGAAAAIFGGWQVNPLVSWYTGTPFNVTSDGTRLRMPGSTNPADQIKPEIKKLGGTGRGQAYYDWTAVGNPDPNRLGNMGLMRLRGPSHFNSDLSLFRRFALSERFNMEFRAEAFNWTNTPKFNNPSGGINNLVLRDGQFQSGVFEVTSTAGIGREGIDERLFRFGLKLQF